jgi:hypothetical protein
MLHDKLFNWDRLLTWDSLTGCKLLRKFSFQHVEMNTCLKRREVCLLAKWVYVTDLEGMLAAIYYPVIFITTVHGSIAPCGPVFWTSVKQVSNKYWTLKDTKRRRFSGMLETRAPSHKLQVYKQLFRKPDRPYY